MFRATVETGAPLPDSSYCYVIQRAAKKLELTGWVSMTHTGALRSELEGEKTAIEKFINQLGSGLFLPYPPPLNVMWSTYRGQFRDIEVRL